MKKTNRAPPLGLATSIYLYIPETHKESLWVSVLIYFLPVNVFTTRCIRSGSKLKRCKDTVEFKPLAHWNISETPRDRFLSTLSLNLHNIFMASAKVNRNFKFKSRACKIPEVKMGRKIARTGNKTCMKFCSVTHPDFLHGCNIKCDYSNGNV